MKTTAKNNAIVIWRIIFTYLVLIFHFDNIYPMFANFQFANGWYIAVEFFFIVSGYLLYTNLDKLSSKYPNGLAYFMHRYARIYPYYLCAFLFSFVFYCITKNILTIGEIFTSLSNNFFELFALQGIGLNEGWTYINNTTWYIPIMLLSGLIIYHCLLKWKDTFCNLVAPLIVVISFSNLYRNVLCMDAVVQTTGFYTNLPLMRGLADMCLGIFAARLTAYISANVKRTHLLRLLGALGFLFVIVRSMKYGYGKADFLYVTVLTLSVSVAFLPSENKLNQYRIIRYWSSITMSIYLVHDAFRTFIFPNYLGIPEVLSTKVLYLGLYLIAVTLFAVIFDAFVKWIVRLFKIKVQ